MTGQSSILVAVDATTTTAVLGTVAELAAATGWKVVLLNVAAPHPGAEGEVGPDAGPGAEPGSGPDTDDRARLDECAVLLAEAGIEAEARVAVGPTIEVILRSAEESSAALIVVSGPRHVAAHRMVLGSTASALLKSTDRPVLVVPTDDAERTAEAGFQSSLERLLDLIDRDEITEDVSSLRLAADEQLAEPASPEERHRHLGLRLKDALERFETDHPSLIRAINDVSYYLSGMGI